MNRTVALLLAAVFLPVALPLGAAQATSGATPTETLLLEDKAGDCQVIAADQAQPCGDRWAAADLTGLSALESVDRVQFRLALRNANNAPEAMFAEDTRYDIGFRVRDEVYRVSIYRRAQSDAPVYFAWLDQYDAGRGQFTTVGSAQAAADGATVTASVERALLLDSQGNPPSPGLPLTDLSVRAENLFGRGSQICIMACTPIPDTTVDDRMPDAGNGTLPLPFLFGVAQRGLARLQSDVPIRSSNGEATTFVFQVRGFNLQERDDRFELAATGVPAGWDVRLPGRLLDLGANSSVLFPVVVTTPFEHKHGLLSAFVLELRSTTDPGSVGRIQVGVRYAQPPQPAGHHNVLTLHSRVRSYGQINDAFNTALGWSGAELFLNAQPDDPLDQHVPVEGYLCGQDVSGTPPVPTDTYCWDAPLSPALDIGLDFDLAAQCSGGPCEVRAPFTTTLPLPGAQLSGTLVYYPPGELEGRFGFFSAGDPVVLAELEPGAPVDLGANSADQELAATVRPTKEGDYVPYENGGALYLRLRLTGVGAALFGFGTDRLTPKLQTGQTSQLTLPLVEYHDRVGGSFTSVSSLSLVAQSEQDRLVNPGKTALFNLTLRNDGEAGSFQVDLAGVHLDWAALVQPAGTVVDLGSGESRSILVRVTVPADARQDDAADLVLAVTGTADLNVRTVAQLVARVDATTDHPDDSLAAQALQDAATKGTPGLQPLAVLAALGAALLLARRRRLD